MRLRLFSLLLSLVCVFSFVLSSLSHTVHADEFYGFIEDNNVSLLDESISSESISINYYMSTLNTDMFAYSNVKDFAEDWSYKEIYLITSFTLPESLEVGQAFNFNWRTDFTGCEKTSYFFIGLYDSNWMNVGTYEPGDFESYNIMDVSSSPGTYNLRFNISNLVSDGAVKYIRVYQKVKVNPPCSVYFVSSLPEITFISDSGKLNSIIEYIKNIFTSIANLPQNIANMLKGFFDNIVNAVTNIGNIIKNAIVDLGNFLIDGIKNLFVPTQEDIQEYTDKWSVLLADRFGCLYEVVDMVSEYVESFKSYNERGTISIPAVSLDFGGSAFVLGGWNVDIVPDGFEFLFDSLKIAIDMVCTIAFVNGLKRRYDNLMERG